MTEALVKIDASEYGLEETKAREIESVFIPMISKMTELEAEFNELAKMEMHPDKCKAAKILRNKYVKVRTGTAKIHKEAKAFYLAGGRFVDGWKNAQLYASQGIEKRLKEIEDHYENIEREKQAKIEAERLALLEAIEVDGSEMNLGKMLPEVWDNFYNGAKKGYEDRIEAERKAEEERIAREKKEAEEREAQRIENERLKKEAEEREAELEAEREKAREAERKAQEEQARIEVEARKKQEVAEWQAKVEAGKREKLRKEKEELEAKMETTASIAERQIEWYKSYVDYVNTSHYEIHEFALEIAGTFPKE